MDSGVASYVTSRKDFFSLYTPGDFGTFCMCNDIVSRMVCTGTICLKTNVGTKVVLNNVKHSLDVCLNIFLLVFWMMKDMLVPRVMENGNSLWVPWLWLVVMWSIMDYGL